MDDKSKVKKRNPYTEANYISKVYMRWVSPLMALGRKKTLEQEDLYDLPKSEESKHLADEFEAEWNKELKKDKPSLFMVLTRVYIVKIMLFIAFPLIQEALRIIQPMLISSLILYFNKQIELDWAIIYTVLISLSLLIICTIAHPFYFQLIRYMIRLRLSLYGLLYKKSLKLNSESSSPGKLISLMATDCTRIEQSTAFLNYIFIAPMQIAISVVFLIKYVDPSMLVGLGVILIFVPLQAILGNILMKYRSKIAKITDERIGLTTEVLGGAKIIKMYCWEEPFIKSIEKIRDKELNSQLKYFIINSLQVALDILAPPLTIYISILAFIYVTNKPLLTSYVILMMGLYMRLCQNIGFMFVRGITTILNTSVSVKRLQDYLLQPEINTVKTNEIKKCNETSVYVNNMNSEWMQNDQTFSLKSISFKVEANQLFAIVGSVGSGKSTLLMSLLGEIPNVTGDVKINGRMFYVSQEAWIFPATIKENILFGKEYNKEKFDEIIEVCSLKDDFKYFPNKEETIVGDKGINLSGGQRARISLARALYNDPDIYLFDDPLSAVDANVGKSLFDNCISGYLKSKVRILVTHQIHHLTNANEIIVLNNGEIQGRGTFTELMDQPTVNFSSLLANLEHNHIEKVKEQITLERQISKKSEMAKRFEKQMSETISEKSNEETTIIEKEYDNSEFKEQRASGSISSNVYKNYFITGIGWCFSISMIIIFLLFQVLSNSSDYLLTYWATKEENNYMTATRNIKLLNECGYNLTDKNINENLNNISCHHFNETISINMKFSDRDTYFYLYSVLIGCIVVLAFVRSITYFSITLRTSRILHHRMIRCIIQAKARFFDLNPVGRLINRFSKDISILDDTLPLMLYDLIQVTTCLMGAVAIAIVTNYLILIPLIPVLALFIYIRSYYLSTIKELKRIEALCRSPIFIHTTNSIQGLKTIRACQNQNEFCNQFYQVLNDHTKSYFCALAVNRWFGINLDFVVTIYTIIVVIICVAVRDYLKLTSGQAGLVLTYLFQLMIFFQYTIRQSAEIENLMISVERIVEYTSIEGENLKEGKIDCPKSWPSNGEISFNNVSFKYDEKLLTTIKDITFNINKNEKIGIVGRTGAGKSSLFQALYRMGINSGTIKIDGIDISEISLHELRNTISIIPQEPTVFMGTVRYNLDPLYTFNDKDLWDTLEIVQLKDVISNMKGGLDANISKGGTNLSVGQKQLFCLARAILKRSKILIIDEATANVDYETDALVQKAIRKYFKNSTVITIAHRIRTIIDSDRIICLSGGRITNFERPWDLLKSKNNIFLNLVQKLGKHEVEQLFKIAKAHAEHSVPSEELEFYASDNNNDEIDDFDLNKSNLNYRGDGNSIELEKLLTKNE